MSTLQMNTSIVIVSVVIDFDIYNRLLKDNMNVKDCCLAPIDNREKNEAVTVCYNRFLNAYDYSAPGWIIFAHQDFEFLEPLAPWIPQLMQDAIYGPYGAKTKRYFGLYYRWMLSGQIYMSCRDGSNRFLTGNIAKLHEPTETFDCCCLFVHSDWIKKTGFRFDENLTFDLYGEDLCIQAQEYYHTKVLMIPIQAQHYAFHPVPSRYIEQEGYLNRKYPNCCYTAQCSHFIGKPNISWKTQVKIKKVIQNVWSSLG
jgi:hypothetical protein